MPYFTMCLTLAASCENKVRSAQWSWFDLYAHLPHWDSNSVPGSFFTTCMVLVQGMTRNMAYIFML